MEKKHLSFFLYNLSGGGIGRVTLNLIEFLAFKRYRIDLICVQKTGDFTDSVPTAVKVYDFQKKNAFKCVLSLAKYIWKERPDVLFSAIPTLNIVAIASNIIAGFRTIVVPTEHMPVSLDEKYNASLTVKIAYTIYPFFYLFAKKIVVNCCESAIDFQRRYSMIKKEKLRVIYNAATSAEIIFKSKDKSEMTKFLSYFNKDEPIVLGVGRLTLQKNISLLIRAFAKVRCKMKCKLVILGQGELEGELKMQAAMLNISDNVVFCGFVKNPYAFMAIAQVFVLSSVYETLPTVLIEALACGARVITTDCFGVKEILDNGRFGRIVKQEDEDAMAEAIIEALNRKIDDAEENSNRGKKFGVRESGERYIDLIEELSANKR